MAPKPTLSQHPGSSAEEIEQEPDWSFGGNHRIGYLNRDGRQPGLTHHGDNSNEATADEEFTEDAQRKVREIRDCISKGELMNFRDVMEAKMDFHLRHEEDHPPGWRFMIDVSEDWVKSQQRWPANIKAEEENEQSKQSKDGDTKQEQGGDSEKGGSNSRHESSDDEENQWKRSQGDQSKKHSAYGGKSDEGYQSGDSTDNESQSEYQKLKQKYSSEEIALLRVLQHEKEYIANLGQNNGKGVSPVARSKDLIDIDVADQFSPDNWIPRSGNLIRQTGKHPLNAEPELSKLHAAGLVTPNELHYVRNHGAVPRLFWETHKLEVENGKLTLSMDELQERFESVNIPIAIACDGNRRGELNLIRKSKGFSWGCGAVSCAYWKGALLRDILIEAGVVAKFSPSQRRFVNFEGADELSEGKYATSIPLEHAMDPANDVLIAYEMNNVKLPPDHGFPCRLIIPGFVGGRCVKWLARIWTSNEENNSHYHIWDNRVLPSFVTEKDGEFASTMFHHPSTACMEQNLNSVIVKPAEGEIITLKGIAERETYRVEGLAYDGGGHEVQRVELSLDGGRTWLYCIRQFPDRPIRHGNKFWSWLHWYIDVDIAHFVGLESLTVRCFNVFKNTQPEEPSWNTMGMMNNCWYVVKTLPTMAENDNQREPAMLFRHPVDPHGQGGWMTPSTEVQLQMARQETGVPDKQFTREEVEKHNSAKDCWIVVNDKVFDATSVLSWHPGGSASILSYAGRLTAETTSSFESIHDEYATKKLNECVLGRLTDKASNFIKESAKAAAQEAAKSGSAADKIFLQKQRWTPVKLTARKNLSKDTRSYTFQLPPKAPRLGLGTCQHIQFGIHMKDKMLIRSYTPTRPVLSSDKDGTFELVVKTYLPNSDQPGGAFSNFLDCMPMNESVDIRGPTGEIEYLGDGKFDLEGKQQHFSKVSMILGGSGLTPGFQLLERVCKSEDDRTQLRVIVANKSEGDILLKEELDSMAEEHKDQCQITHVLSHPSENWQGLRGHVNEDIIKEHCFEPQDGAVALLCGPPPMIQKAALPALKDWGYKEEKNCFGF